MTALLRAELLKMRTTRTMLGLTSSLVALVIVITLLNGYVTNDAYLHETKNQFTILANGSIAAAFAALAGILSITAEFRHGTIRPTLLTAPSRTRVLAAKLVVSTFTGVVLGVVGIGLSFGLGMLALSSRGVGLQLDNGQIALVVAGGIGASALWGAFGLALGAAVRNQVGAIVGLLIWAFVVESIVFALVPSVGRYLPAQALNALTQIEVPHLLTVLPGTLVFGGYLLAASVAGLLVTTRRDV